MASVNRVFLMGNLGSDPVLRATPQGQSVTTFSLATSDPFTDAQGNRVEHTDWHRIIVWGRSAEACANYLCKGRFVHVEGSLRSRSYTDSAGQMRGVVEVVARKVEFLGGNGQHTREHEPDSVETEPTWPAPDEDIPF